MKYEKLTNNQVKFTVTITPDEFNHALDHSYQHIKDDVEIKGFRKGQAPRSLYEKKFGQQALWTDALNHAIGHKFEEALLIKDFTIVSNPTNVDIDFEKISTEKPFDLTFEVAIKPEVELGTYKGIEVKKVSTRVTKKAVDEAIQNLLTREVSLVPKASDIIENGDTAIFDFEGFVDGETFEGGKAENFQLEIGSGQFIPGFEEQMIGMKAGETKDLVVTFPSDYSAQHLAGKEATFKVKLYEVKVKEQHVLNDAWVKTLKRDGVETVEQLEESIKADLKAEKEKNAKNEITNEILDKLIKSSKVDVPQAMFDQEIENYRRQIENQAKQYQLDFDTFIQLSGFTKEKFDEHAEDISKNRVLQSLVIEAVAKKENFKATKKELDQRYQELADMYKMKVEEIKQYVTDELVTNDIAFEKAVDFLVANAIQK